MSAIPLSQPIGVIGVGAMGAGIAQIAAVAGHQVLLCDADAPAIERARTAIALSLERFVTRGAMTEAARDATLARLTPVRDMAGLAPAHLVIEAVIEDLAVKQDLFARLEKIVGPSALIASNTSSLSVTAMSAAMREPARLIALHFFNPVPVMALVEVVPGLATEPATVATAVATCTAWGKVAVVARNLPGFIVNRVARPFYLEGLRVAAEGAADYATIDAVLREAGGFRMGPIELIDLVGVDVSLRGNKSFFATYFGEPRYQPSLLQQEVVDLGRYGRKSGHGFYDYAEGAPRAAPKTAPAGPPPPSRIRLSGDLGPAQALVALIEQAGIPVEREASNRGLMSFDGIALALTDGRLATERAAETGAATVLFDLALDYETAGRIALAAADTAPPMAAAQAASLFQALGKQVSILDDCPGLIVARTVCGLVNSGADALLHGVCTPEALDTAMRLGVNYPRGPLEWGDQVGLDYVLAVMDNMAATYGEPRYRASPLLRRRALSGGQLRDDLYIHNS